MASGHRAREIIDSHMRMGSASSRGSSAGSRDERQGSGSSRDRLNSAGSLHGRLNSAGSVHERVQTLVGGATSVAPEHSSTGKDQHEQSEPGMWSCDFRLKRIVCRYM